MIYVKSDKEIELMRKPCAIVRDVLNLVQDKIRAGMTTKELDRIAHEYITSCVCMALCHVGVFRGCVL